MNQQQVTINKLEKKLQTTAKMKKWTFIGGAATASLVVMDFFTKETNALYLLSQVLLAIFCFVYSYYLSHQHRIITSDLDTIQATVSDETQDEVKNNAM
ncbi:hypothetical protein [Yersinia aldovae]|uniref:hypothetical protein n=1 Tax=Yersinia aldovae TaxID=29483 RepID=UPI0005AD1C25|nr:hypothetical protein [Yersinia aldovae]AJJ63653.1 hypothetical protein AT01_1392 [Yersinia aldovae 670-83]